MVKVFHHDTTGKTLKLTLENVDSGKFWVESAGEDQATTYATAALDFTEGTGKFVRSYSSPAISSKNGIYLARVHDDVASEVIDQKVIFISAGAIRYEQGSGQVS